MSGQRIHLLGTGASAPDPSRAPSAILVESSDRGALLIDVGDGTARSLAQPEYEGLHIATILLTHNHPDHLGGLPHLLQGLKGEKRSDSLEILAPKQLADALPGWLAPLRLALERLPFSLEIKPIAGSRQTLASGHPATFWMTDHFTDDDLGDECFGLTLHLEGGDWLFSSDLKTLTPLREQLDGATGLIAESAHVDPHEVVMLARNAGLSTIVLTHIPKGAETPAIEGATWAFDGMVIEIDSFPEEKHD